MGICPVQSAQKVDGTSYLLTRTTRLANAPHRTFRKHLSIPTLHA